MDKQLLQKYFRNQCSLEEIEQVLDWFQTKEGQAYFEETLDQDMERYAGEDNLLLYPDVPSDRMLLNIRRRKQAGYRKKTPSTWKIKAAVAIIICAVLAGVNFILQQSDLKNGENEPEITYRTISTQNDQHRLLTLSDGTRIRLNANSAIEIPEYFSEHERLVSLSGEAWFEVAPDKDRPFSIQAEEATILVLGTEFNVRVDTLSRNVQIAVAEGRVSLSKKTSPDGNEAILSKDTFALYNLDNEEILIEQTNVENYLSWISGKLYFYNEPLWVVSRYLERIYGVTFQFSDQQLKDLPLSTDIPREELSEVLDIIAKTLRIDYSLENKTVLWNNT